MKKIVFIFILLIPTYISALTYPELHYDSAIIYDITDEQVLFLTDILPTSFPKERPEV